MMLVDEFRTSVYKFQQYFILLKTKISYLL